MRNRMQHIFEEEKLICRTRTFLSTILVGKNYKGICIDSLVSVNTLGISAMQLIGINKISFAVRPVLLL
jgi:hypothetical protein